MRPSEALDRNRENLRALLAGRPVRNPRLFGSVLRGEDREGSDLDLLVDAIPEVTTLFDMIRLERDAESLLGVPVDIRTPEDVHASFRGRVLAEAQSL